MNKLFVLVAAALALPLTACGGVSEMTKQQVARSEFVVNQAQTTLGMSEAGAVELQRAKENMAQAQQALAKKADTQAQRLAIMAELDAQLAVAKGQSAVSRKAADDLLVSIQTLKQEAARSGTSR